VTESLAAGRKTPIDQIERSADTPHLPKEIENLLDAAIHRSVDAAIHASGLKLARPQEQEIVQRVSRDATIAVQQTISASYYGPIPPPAMLGEFDRVVPGLAAQIVTMALAEQKHRHRWERTALRNDIFMQSGALALGWVLAGGALIGAFVFGMENKVIPMSIILGVPALQMIRVVVVGNQPKAPLAPSATAPPKARNKRNR
jgi:hypothetical protein